MSEKHYGLKPHDKTLCGYEYDHWDCQRVCNDDQMKVCKGLMENEADI